MLVKQNKEKKSLPVRESKGLEEMKHGNKKGVLSVLHMRFNAQAWAQTLTPGRATQVPALDVD